jgi:hypothetical protein
MERGERELTLSGPSERVSALIREWLFLRDPTSYVLALSSAPTDGDRFILRNVTGFLAFSRNVS